MPHPGNDRRFGSFLDWDSFRSGHGSTADRRRMIGHNASETASKLGMAGMEGEKRPNRFREVFDVLCLDRFTAFGIGHFSFCKALCGPFGFQFRSNPFNGRP